MIKVEMNCSSQMMDEAMEQIRGMGIEYLAVNFLQDDTDYDSVMRFMERAEKHRLKVGNAGCPTLQKCSSIHLGKEDRDIWIDKYNDFTRV